MRICLVEVLTLGVREIVLPLTWIRTPVSRWALSNCKRDNGPLLDDNERSNNRFIMARRLLRNEEITDGKLLEAESLERD
jgi:hypothetical protein